jgi:hypothetical protein
MCVRSGHRDMEHLAAEDVACGNASGYHGCPCPVNASIRSLRPAESEFHDTVILCGADNAGGLCGDQD